MSSSSLYRVAIVDDHQFFRECFELFLKQHSNISITGSYASAEMLYSDIASNSPDIIFMDIDMPQINGIEATKQILSKHPSIKIIVLSHHGDGLTASLSFQAGAVGYITKNQATSNIQDALKCIELGEKYITPEIALEFAKFNIQATPLSEKETELIEEKKKYSPRELMIMSLLSDGKTDKEIGVSLNISPKTVDKDKRNVMKIMGVNKVTHIVSIAIRKGLIS